MPIYTFENTKTGENFEKIMKMDEREVYLSANPHIDKRLPKHLLLVIHIVWE